MTHTEADLNGKKKKIVKCIDNLISGQNTLNI